MPTQPPLPPLLAPYVSSLPHSSLTVLSSVLGATGNWLVLRFLYAALSSSSNSETAFGLNGSDGVKNRRVVLVSFLRGWEFWRSEAKRLGLDLARLTDKRQFAFIDGLSELFYNTTTATATPQQLFPGTAAPRTVLPVRSQPSPVPARTPHPVPRPGNVSTNPASREIGPVKRLHLSGNGTAALDALERDIATVIQQLKASTPGEAEEPEVLLIVDQPDLLLAATGPNKGIGATEMGDWVMGLQQNTHATILTLSSDSPLIHNASASAPHPATPLETEHAAFAIGSAHRAQMVMQLRNLETGAARDVSGVLRVSKGGAWGQNEVGTEGNWEEREVLYFVQRDGGVSVFGRGE
ncbi:hypothetical protein BDV27DRAFT_55238 [Aspergillus caelatus]|uniref:Elongator complex protein 6 n=2 Tax=Aspergillus subgen. Circumdati TaxID=2720871 RepID=A0A5N6ZQ59_9EURO|nr:uncharacterized protein BDV27DRAFT_55238 [Aspergillus caelatus]KAE8359363.1 hypothetical protein BDV27DRAFT_55238 [Aspergillus caelatus]KAE8410896.1 hypothetical protein BDV36DRAFT_104720 [Aspergillus pseudocaelatus]